MIRIIALMALSALTYPAFGQTRGITPGHPGLGAAVAQKWCADCHVTGQGGNGSDIAPSFAEIAATRTDEYVRGFLANPHGRQNMPPILLDPKEIENLVSYLGTLRAPGKEPGIPR